jgi:hypothetical protein
LAGGDFDLAAQAYAERADAKKKAAVKARRFLDERRRLLHIIRASLANELRIRGRIRWWIGSTKGSEGEADLFGISSISPPAPLPAHLDRLAPFGTRVGWQTSKASSALPEYRVAVRSHIADRSFRERLMELIG